MASVSVSHLIIFIAAMVVAASVAGALTTTVNDISNAIDEQGPSVSDDIRSDISIINDPGADVENDGDLELFVKNTGSTELTTNSDNIDVLVNGVFTQLEEDAVTIQTNDNDVWGQNDVAQINVNVDPDTDLNDGENRVKIVVDGAEDTFIWERN